MKIRSNIDTGCVESGSGTSDAEGIKEGLITAGGIKHPRKFYPPVVGIILLHKQMLFNELRGS